VRFASGKKLSSGGGIAESNWSFKRLIYTGFSQPIQHA